MSSTTQSDKPTASQTNPSETAGAKAHVEEAKKDVSQAANKSSTSTASKDTAAKDTASTDTTSKTETKSEDATKNNPTTDEISEGTDGDKKPKADETPNSDGFIPGTPLEKNHKDTSVHAHKDKEHDKHAAGAATGDKEHAEKHGLMDKVKGAMHHHSKEPQAEK